jgi:DNA polymerase III epsilon subunit-like protein
MNGELLRFNKQQKYLIFDTETEHLNLISSKPWQVAWIVAQGDKILEKHDVYIYWKNLQVSEGAAKVTGFSQSDYERRAIPNNEAWDKFSQYLYDDQYKIVGHNLLGFDVYMVNSWRKYRKMPSDYSFVDRIIDTNSLAKAIEKNIPVDKNNFLAWQYKLINFRERGLKTSQGALLKKYNIPHDPKKLHDALYDITMNYEIFKKQLYDIEL